MAVEGPTVRRRRLGLELKRCREEAGMTQEQVAEHFEWYTSKVTRIETARVSVTPRDVRDMLSLYGVEDEEYRNALVDLARRSKEKSWWADYKDIMRSGAFIGLEAEAVSLRTWQPIMVHGLLQTSEYARALLKLGLPDPDPESIDRRVELRMKRQERLTAKEQPLHLSVIFDESVVRRVVGDKKVMRGQLNHLLELSQLPNVNLQLLPLDSRQNATIGGPATLIEFREALDLDVVYLEGVAGDYYEEQPEEVARYRRIFERLSASALSLDETATLIAKVLETYQ